MAYDPTCRHGPLGRGTVWGRRQCRNRCDYWTFGPVILTGAATIDQAGGSANGSHDTSRCL